MNGLQRVLDRRYEHYVLAVMLIVLHVAMRWDLGSPVSASLMTAHLGLFFIWQPIWQRDQRLDPLTTGLIVLFAAVFITALNAWLIFGWLIVLVGLVSGRTLHAPRERLTYMLAQIFLVSELLIGCVPELFVDLRFSPSNQSAIDRGLLIIPLVLAIIPVDRATVSNTFPIDFFRGVTFALLTALLAISAVLLTREAGLDYAGALFNTLISMALVLLLLSWLLSPRAGSGSLLQIWEKSLLNIGTPFEQWSTELSRLAEEHTEPRAFLQAAITHLTLMPWIAGAEWHIDTTGGSAGQTSRYKFDLDNDELSISVYTNRSAGPTMLLHCKLLMQLVGQFYAAKLRAHEQASQAHLQAIHETGARLTHDIKNLLQSLRTMTSALSSDAGAPDDDLKRQRDRRAQALLKKQLPLVTRRLQLALDKLQAPEEAREPGDDTRIMATQWFQQLAARYADTGIEFESSLQTIAAVPNEIFDSIAENLLENALTKRQSEPHIEIDVTFAVTRGRISLRVSDTGSAVPDDMAAGLFREAVQSASGLGIGLYQAARSATAAGYQLTLKENLDGHVCFELSRLEPGEQFAFS
ncbi:MAG: HAMP domain-containing histidine kinase [Gammaproteobacteria bacterium]|nr:HAMP domain-containing histidine kinase [Gammaproteobacteria bacterium]